MGQKRRHHSIREYFHCYLCKVAHRQMFLASIGHFHEIHPASHRLKFRTYCLDYRVHVNLSDLGMIQSKKIFVINHLKNICIINYWITINTQLIFEKKKHDNTLKTTIEYCNLRFLFYY